MPTKIPWCNESINPWVGCTKVRAGCRHCYAERLAYRLAAMGQVGYQIALDGRQWSGRIAYQMEQLEKLKHWRKPRRVFMGSMTDIFHEAVPFCEIRKVFDAMCENPQHTYIVATKRPDEALAFTRSQALTEWGMNRIWPAHIHLLISCSTQNDLDEMAPVLFQIPAAVRGVSFEPLIEEIDVEPYLQPRARFDWVIVGCEKLVGNHTGRFCAEDARWWQAARDIAQRSKATGVACYMKQGPLNGKVVSDPKDFPEDLRIRELPK